MVSVIGCCVPKSFHLFSRLFFWLFLLMQYGEISAQRAYVYTYCNRNINYTANGQFQRNLNRLLLQTLDNGGSSGFKNASVGESPDQVNGLVLCRGDVNASTCSNCINVANEKVMEDCPGNKEAIIWYDQCLLRYSNRSFFSTMEDYPAVFAWNVKNVSQPRIFNETLDKMFYNLTSVAISDPSGRKYENNQANYGDNLTIYGLVQCTPDITAQDCKTCLNTAIGHLLVYASGKQGGRVLQPSCNIRFETSTFTLPGSPPPVPSSSKPDPDQLAPVPSPSKDNAIGIKVGASISAVAVVALAVSYFLYMRRRKQKRREEMSDSQEIQLLDFGGGSLAESGEDLNGENQKNTRELPLIKFDHISVATQHFSRENKLGEGGFGPVYKGTLPNGKEIAVKRLARTSGQGLLEFKNEVTLIAKLQHRNLVRLLGCSLEKDELLLIYEYMPNKSLDNFLFDSSKAALLDWQRRLHIINGIARGVLYLHEDSRLRIIHRDLKTSNVLLDHDMNPKISDFGMARIFGGTQNEANTNRVVGTYGYMAPEYAMGGLFSIKSDVFSFGVLLLEIISGKKSSSFHLAEHGQSLLDYTWKLWSECQALELLDPLLAESCVESEVLKCIHIGLLCVQEDPADRPTMSAVVVMLASDTSTKLPRPTPPAFSVGRAFTRQPESDPQSNIMSSSTNEVSVSVTSPR